MWIVIAVVVVAIAGAVFAKVKSDQKKEKALALENISWTAKNLFAYSSPTENTRNRIKEEMQTILATPWMEEEFRTQAVAEIQKTDMSLTYGIGSASMNAFWIKEDQLLLEEMGYQCPEIKSAYEEMMKTKFSALGKSQGIAVLTSGTLNGPNDEEGEIYNKEQLSYYTDPKTVFLTMFLSGYVETTLAEKNTEKLLDLCEGLNVVRDHTDLAEVVDLQKVFDGLTTGAEQITVKPGEGYYKDKENGSDTDFSKDPIWSQYLPGDLITSTTNSVKYYGDLASFFFSRDTIRQDEEGKGHTVNSGSVSNNTTYLKDTRIAFTGVSERYIKYAYEDGMVSYYKDGYCFAIGDNKMTCFLEDEFLFEFGQK